MLIFIDWFYPAYKAGGPIKSVFNLTQSIGQVFDILIVTSNEDVDGEKLDVLKNNILNEKHHSIIYLDSNYQNAKVYKDIFEQFQPKYIYYNSLFSIKFTLLPYLLFKKKNNVTNILAPRGMLGEGALSIKPIKKKLFLWVTKKMLFKNNLIWHASTKDEREEIFKNYGKQSVVKVAQNISGTLHRRDNERTKKIPGQLELIFLSRISSKKNLMFALQLMTDLIELKGLRLSIYGPIEQELNWKEHESVIEGDSRIKYMGLLKPNQITDTLQKSHLYILPSLNENYGHSIVESILSGVPILISNQTPWTGLEKFNIGADISLNDRKPWIDNIRKFYEMDALTYDTYVDACYSFAKKKFLSKEIVEDNSRLFM